MGTVDLEGAVGQQWATDTGIVTVVWPLYNEFHPRLDRWARQIGGAGHRAMVAVTGRFWQGPELEAVLPAHPSRQYGPRWTQLAQVLGQPVPYWPSTLREAQLIRDWQPGTEPVTAMAVPVLDTGTLLQTASAYADGHPAARVLVTTPFS